MEFCQSEKVGTLTNKEASRLYAELLSHANNVHASRQCADDMQMIYVIPGEISPEVSFWCRLQVVPKSPDTRFHTKTIST